MMRISHFRTALLVATLVTFRLRGESSKNPFPAPINATDDVILVNAVLDFPLPHCRASNLRSAAIAFDDQ